MAFSPSQLIAEYPFLNDPTAPFASANEMSAAMMSPKYRQDEGFRGIVEARLAATDRGVWGMVDHRPRIQATLTPPVALTRDDNDPEANAW